MRRLPAAADSCRLHRHRSATVCLAPALHRWFINREQPTAADVARVWRVVLQKADEERLGDLTLSCAYSELTEATASRKGGGVQAVGKCVGYLHEWGYLEQLPSLTTISLSEDLRDMNDVQQLPSGVRRGTQQAVVWLLLSTYIGLPVGGATRQLEAEKEELDHLVSKSGLQPTQFSNALRALKVKGLLSVSRPPSVQLQVPAVMKIEPLPPNSDERWVPLTERRRHSLDKLSTMQSYAGCIVRGEEDESDALWNNIMRYFGEDV